MFAPLPALLLATLKVPSTTVNHNSQLHYCLPLLQAQALLLVTTLFHLAASRPPWCAGAGSVSQLNSLHIQCQHLRGGCSIPNIGQVQLAPPTNPVSQLDEIAHILSKQTGCSLFKILDSTANLLASLGLIPILSRTQSITHLL